MAIEFDGPQQKAIAHVHGPMLVLAGAGTGKTTVLVERVVKLLREGHAELSEILAVSYTENSAADIRKKVQACLPDVDCSPLKAETFHAYCFKLLRRHERAFGVVDNADLWIFLRRNLSELRLERFIKAANPAEFLHDLIEFCSRCRDELVTASDYRKYVERVHRGELPLPRVGKSSETLSRAEVLARCDELARVYETVEQLLASRNHGTFGDMVLRAVALLRTDPQALERERAAARYILIDEFQDSNAAQIELAALLGGEQQNVFAVGDPDQAIYRFRGASSGAFQEFLQRFPGSERVMLERNHRSTAPILRAGFKAINRNPESGAALDFARKQLHAARSETIGPGEPVMVALCSSAEAEAAEIVESIFEAHRSGASYSRFAILLRQHSHRDKLVEELRARSIPFSVAGLDALEAGVVRDLVAVLRLLRSPNDPVSFLRVAALPRFELEGEQVRRRLRESASQEDLISRFLDSRGGHDLAAALRQCRDFAFQQAAKMSELLPEVIREFGLSDPGPSVALDTFIDFVAEWEKKPITSTKGLAEFLEYLDHFPEAKGKIELPVPPLEADTVRLLTVHTAKGLGFDRVFLPRLNSPSFPTGFREPLFEFPNELRVSPRLQAESPRALHNEEERRLFYVAVTRARDSLTLCARPGTGKEQSPSGFLRELLKDMHGDPVLICRQARPYTVSLAAAAQPASPISNWLDLPPVHRLPEFTLSATAIQTYRTCPLQFKIHYDWRLPGDAPAALQFGHAMHSALKFYFDPAEAPPVLDGLLDFFRSALAELPFDDLIQRELYAKQGVRQLTAFHESFKASPRPAVLHTERTFEVDIADVRVRGRVDRLDQSSGGNVNITDYKTGRPQEQKDADESLQLSIYALAAQRAWRLTPAQLTFHNLENNSLVETSRSALELHETEEMIRDIADQIAAGNFGPKKGFHCRRCAYVSICPAQEQRLYEIQPAQQSFAAVSMKVQ